MGIRTDIHHHRQPCMATRTQTSRRTLPNSNLLQIMCRTPRIGINRHRPQLLLSRPPSFPLDSIAHRFHLSARSLVMAKQRRRAMAMLAEIILFNVTRRSVIDESARDPQMTIAEKAMRITRNVRRWWVE